MIETLERATAGAKPADVDAMLEEARRARRQFSRPVTGKEVSAWISEGRA